MHDYHKEEVAVDSIRIPKTHRRHTPEQVQIIADSIQEVGLINPITITRDYVLIAGEGRVEAYKLLGLMTIEARMMLADEIQQELAEIDENLIRNNYTALEEATATARRKVLYEAMHPETKHGHGPKTPRKPASDADSERRQIDDSQKNSPEVQEPPKDTPKPNKVGSRRQKPKEGDASFVEDTAKRTGKSKSTVERAARTGSGINPEVVPLLLGTPIENKKGELEQLSKLPSAKQVAVAIAIKSGLVNTVAAAVDPAKAATLKDHAGNAIPESLVPRWNRAKEFDALSRQISLLIKRVEELAKDEEIGGWLDALPIRRDLENAQRGLKFARPYTLDHLCDGHGCVRCRGTGWLVESAASISDAKAA